MITVPSTMIPRSIVADRQQVGAVTERTTRMMAAKNQRARDGRGRR